MVIVAMEESPCLIAVNRIIGSVKVQDDLIWSSGMGTDKLFHKDPAILARLLRLMPFSKRHKVAAEDKPLDENSPEVKQMVLLNLREPTTEEVEQLYKRKTVQRAAERS